MKTIQKSYSFTAQVKNLYIIPYIKKKRPRYHNVVALNPKT